MTQRSTERYLRSALAGASEAAFRDASEGLRPPSPERDSPRDSVAPAADGSRTWP
jgi:hypothetical protein